MRAAALALGLAATATPAAAQAEAFAPYGPAAASLALWAILVLVLSGLSTLGRGARAPCGKPVRDYADPAYRRERAFANAVESSGPFAAAMLAAIAAGAAPFWVNLLAALFVAARIAVATVHIATENQPARSAFWAVGTVCILALALLALGTVLA